MGCQTMQQRSVECCLSTAPWTNVAILCQGGERNNGAAGPSSHRLWREAAPGLAACKCTRRTGDLGLFTTSTAHPWVGWAHPWIGWGGVSRPRRAVDDDYNGGMIDSWRAVSIYVGQQANKWWKVHLIGTAPHPARCKRALG